MNSTTVMKALAMMVGMTFACAEAKPGVDTADTGAAAVDMGLVDMGVTGDDSGVVDPGSDAGVRDAEPVDATLVPGNTGYSVGSGGNAASANHRIKVQVGAPQPVGLGVSPNHRIILKPPFQR